MHRKICRAISYLFLILIPPSTLQQRSGCPPLLGNLNGLQLDCYFNRQFVGCSNAASPGTKATYNCHQGFVSVSDNKGHNDNDVYTMLCLQSGEWSGHSVFRNYRCRPQTEVTRSCGQVRESKFVPLIVGGNVTNSEDWPWHAALFNNGGYVCGGSLISPEAVLTAAHCVVNHMTGTKFSPDIFAVALGGSSSHIEKLGGYAQIFNVKKVVIHPNYDYELFTADIALIFLGRSATLNEVVNQVCLPPEDTLWYRENLIGEVVGFGSIDSTGNPSTLLRIASLPIVRLALCSASVGAFSTSTICAGFDTGDEPAKAVCYGDSGSGYVFKEYGDGAGQQRYHIEGIVSTTLTDELNQCKSYGKFTKVRYFIPWIQNELNKGNDVPLPPPPPPPPPSSTPPPPPPVNVPSPRSVYSPCTSPPSTSTIYRSPEYATYTEVQILSRDLQNQYRSYHGAPPLRLNSHLNAEAQTWANHLINTNNLFTKSDSDYRQNLYAFTIIGGSKSPADVMRLAVENWYSTKSSYNSFYPTPASYSFSQLVWKGTTDMGVGLSTRNGRTVVVACYFPGGNIFWLGGDGDRTRCFRENVQL